VNVARSARRKKCLDSWARRMIHGCRL
jgi:hypothetical protein